MRKSKQREPESTVFDRSPARDKLQLDLNIAITNATQMGLSHADTVAALLLEANHLCEIAEESGDDLSSIKEMLAELAS